jgi:cell division control protein 24
MTPIRTTSFSSNPVIQGNTMSSNTSTPIRIPSNALSMSSTNILTNRQTSSDDSLYYICLHLMNSLSKVPGMLPYIELAYNQADLAAEQQTLSLSNIINNNNDNNNNNNNNSNNNNNNNNDFNDNSTIQSTENSTRSSNYLLSNWNNSLFTFATGLLPAQISYDPVTAISKLFRQGTPLCLLFNAIKPENSIEIISSDDLKICKMNIYQFLSACKLNLNIRDDELFPVTMIFSDNTAHLLRVIHSINFVLNLEPSFISPPIPDQLKITDSRSKIIKELIETERRFVQDLKILIDYRDELIKSECLVIEDINILFPNLNEIIDFQRKFLIGLECNSNIPNKYQRIGSVFIHVGVEGFKIYENWSLFQTSVIEIIHREANNLKNISKIIPDPYDLQNFFLIKPIQRLLKYPLLLSQLLKESDQSWPNYNELNQAYLISKEVASDINESQRRSENIKSLSELQDKVIDWKGYNTKSIGELLFFNIVTVKDLLTDGHSNEKEVHCYLFEKVIYFFKEVSQKNKILGSKKMGNAFNNSLNSLNNNNNYNNNNNNNNNNQLSSPLQLSLNGIVYINKIYKISATDHSPYFTNIQNGHFLALKWKANKDSGGCIMKFRSDEHLNQWNNTIKKLSVDSGLDEFYGIHNSTKSVSSISSSNSLLTGDTNRSSNTTTNTSNRNSDRLRSSSDSNTFMKKLRSTSSSSFSNLSNISNISYPPLPTEKTLRSMSISSLNNNNLNSFKQPNRKSSSNTSIFNNEELISNMSNLTLSNQVSFTLSSNNMTNIKLIFNNNKSIINLSVNSDQDYESLVNILVQKMNYNMSTDNLFTYSNVVFKFKDEDNDYIRFQGNDDWEIAKEMLEEMDPDSRILELVVF